MKSSKTGIEVWDLDGSGMRCAVARDGIVRYVGPREECMRRAQILVPRNDREQQDLMLLRSFL